MTLAKTCAPDNMSLLNPGEFRIYIHRAPYLSFFVQTVALPTINLPSVDSENPFTSIPMPGDHIEWEPLSVIFLVDEDLKGYSECYNWIRGLGFPETFEEYKQALESGASNRFEATTSPISVFTNTGSKNANIEFIFDDAVPTMVSAPTLSTDHEADVPVVTAKVSFMYTKFDVRKVNI